MARYDEKTDENRRSHTLLPCKSKPRDADGADCGDDKSPTATYPQGWTTSYIQSGLCRNLPLSRYVCQGRRTNYVDDIMNKSDLADYVCEEYLEFKITG